MKIAYNEPNEVGNRLHPMRIISFSQLVQAVGGPGTVIIGLLLAVVLPAVLGRWVLGPVSDRAGRLQGVLRFQLSDFFWLVIQFQLVLGYCVRFVGVRQAVLFPLTLIGTSLGMAALWMGAISFMSRAKVTEGRRRATFVMFVLPAVVAYLMVTTFVLLVVTDSWFELFSRHYRGELEDMLTIMSLTKRQLTVSLVALPILAWTLRRIALWVVADSTAVAATAESKPCGTAHSS